MDLYKKGFDAYIGGDWPTAKEHLEQVIKLRVEGDNPSNALLGYMKNHKFKAPDDWKGYHKFGEK